MCAVHRRGLALEFLVAILADCTAAIAFAGAATLRSGAVLGGRRIRRGGASEWWCAHRA